MADERDDTLIALTADIVSAQVANNSVALSDVPIAISRVHEALAGLGQVAAPAAQIPAVSVRASVKPDYVVCLEDGKKMKMLKRHLTTDHQMTPAEYRAKWNLPVDYPMVAPNYAQKRRELAVKIGLGHKKGTKASARRSGGRGKAAPAS
jgi:predicted transcriptional regulator